MKRRDSIRRFAFLLIAAVYPGHSSADAPPGRYAVAATTVKDNRTGLTWQRSVGATQYYWADAKTYCDALSLDGKGDWRLPTDRELLTLIDPTLANPAIDPTAFPDTPADFFWSASALPNSGANGDAWSISFFDGTAENTGKLTLYFARCVR